MSGIQHQRATQLQQFLLAAGQVPRLQLFQRCKAQELQVPPRRPRRRRAVECGRARPGTSMFSSTLMRLNKLRDLEGAADAQRGEPLGASPSARSPRN